MSFNRQQFLSDFIDDFYAESEEHLANIRTQLLALQEDLAADALTVVFEELLRSLHTLKGLSSMVGIREIEQIAHHTEEYVRHIKASGALPSPEGAEALIEVAESLHGALKAMHSREPILDPMPLINRLAFLSASPTVAAAPAVAG